MIFCNLPPETKKALAGHEVHAHANGLVARGRDVTF
jgi:hypothetical protein